MPRIGYARVSSRGQSLDVQLQKLADCEEIFQEQESGTKQTRPKLEECLRYLRKGDTLVVTRIDRLARSTQHLCLIADGLRDKGVELEFVDQHIDTNRIEGKLLFTILSGIAEFENDLRAQRQSEGIKRAKERGIQFGKPRALTPSQIDDLKSKRRNGVLIRDLMTDFSISKASVYRYLAA